MHHAAAAERAVAHEALERARAPAEVVARAVRAPLDGDERVREVERAHLRGGVPRRQAHGRRAAGGAQERAPAADRREELAVERVVHDADDGGAADAEAQRDGDVRVAVHEVGRAVDGVDDEGRRRRQPGPAVRLLAQEEDVRVRGRERGLEEGFDGGVGLGHQVDGCGASRQQGPVDGRRGANSWFW